MGGGKIVGDCSHTCAYILITANVCIPVRVTFAGAHWVKVRGVDHCSANQRRCGRDGTALSHRHLAVLEDNWVPWTLMMGYHGISRDGCRDES